MRSSRHAYHCAIRKVRKDKEFINSERIAVSLCSAIIHAISGPKLNGSGQSLLVRVVDGVFDCQAISKIFVDKYRKLYTCVFYRADKI